MDDLRIHERDLARHTSRFKDHPLFAKGGPLKDSGEEVAPLLQFGS